MVEDERHLERERPAPEEPDLGKQVTGHAVIDDLLHDSVCVDDSKRPVGVPGLKPEVPAAVAQRATSIQPEEAETVQRRPKTLYVDFLSRRGRRGERQEPHGQRCSGARHQG